MRPLPADLQAEVDQHAATVRDLLDTNQAIADALEARQDIGVIMANFGCAIVGHILAAKDDMQFRALAWVDYLENYRR